MIFPRVENSSTQTQKDGKMIHGKQLERSRFTVLVNETGGFIDKKHPFRGHWKSQKKKITRFGDEDCPQ